MLGEERARGLTLVAGYQESGGGRKGRSWVAPPGSALLCTVGLPDPLPARDVWLVPFWIAYVVCTALRTHDVDTTLQWPNDVLAHTGKKIAGILCVSRTIGEYAWAGCGIGINVHRPPDESAFAALESPPAFVSDFSAASVEDVLQTLLRVADERYDLLEQPARLIADWQACANLPGVRYRVLLDGQTRAFDAVALRLLPGGALLVDESGEQRTIALADARVLR